MSSLMENSSMTELFYAIDNISNNNDENDTIVEKIIDKFYILFKSHLSYKRKKEEKAREAMLKSYKEYLYGFNKIITKQMTVIESMLNEPFTSDMSDIFVKLQKELDEYSMKKYIIEFSFMSSFLSKKECDIFKNVQIYSFLDKYHNNLKECDVMENYTGEESKEEFIVKRLIEGPDEKEYNRIFSKDIKLISVMTTDNICYVNFNSNFLTEQIVGSPELAIYSIVNSLSELNYVHKVQIMVNGDTNVSFKGVKLDNAFIRNLDYIENETKEGE